MTSRNELAKIIKWQRVMKELTLHELGVKSAVSASHLGRIERGERFPSARILQKIAKPLSFSEAELFTLANYLTPKASITVESEAQLGRLNPYVAAMLLQEPVAVQRAVIGILSVLGSLGKGIAQEQNDCIGFAEYIHRNYPEIDEDIITMIEDVILVATRSPQKAQPADSGTP